MTDMSYQDSRQQGEAASYYTQPSHSQYPNQSGPGGQQGYGQPNNPPYGNQYDSDRQQYQGGDSYPQNDGPDGPGADGERGLMGGLAGAAAGAYGGHKMGHGVIGAIGGAVVGHKLQDFVQDRKEKKEEEKLQQQTQHQQNHGTPPPGYSQGPYHAPQHHSSDSHSHHQGGCHSPSRDRSIGSSAGNFSASSHDIHLEGDYDLQATCKRSGGGSQVSTLNLNSVLSNEDGHFRWVKGGSGASSVTVRQGDTLREIARRCNCSFEDIARRNNIANPDMIYPGQVLQVPGESSGNFSASARDIRLVDGGRVLEAELRNTRGDWHRARINLDERVGNEDGRLCFL